MPDCMQVFARQAEQQGTQRIEGKIVDTVVREADGLSKHW